MVQESGKNRTSNNRLDISNEVNEVNTHTLNNEFHGPTSSLAFLAAIQRQIGTRAQLAIGQPSLSEDQPSSLVSTFHNETFSPTSVTYTDTEWHMLAANSFYFRQSQLFLTGYFQNLHYIHPIVDRTTFSSRCEDLWFGVSSKQSKSFIALYYAIMSLGALTREWDEGALDTMNRFEWSRKMFKLATVAAGEFPGRNDLESVQAYIIMAKVCQNELGPNLAYMYLGHAIRTSLSAGYNRRSSRQGLQEEEKSRTWWGLFSLEMETSFALGRPDSLGDEIYHTQPLPTKDESPSMIITSMVDLAKIIRTVSSSVYLSGEDITRKAVTAGQIESQLEIWLKELPSVIQPPLSEMTGNDTDLRCNIPIWANRQSHTLLFRYYNVKMVLYRPFLLYFGHKGHQPRGHLEGAVTKCVFAATKTIELMHRMFCNFSYFRTWWYNTTYTLYAVSIIVFYAHRIAPSSEIPELLRLIDMSVNILKIMDENVVAKKAAALVHKASMRIGEKEMAADCVPSNGDGHPTQGTPAANPDRVEDVLFDELVYDPFDQDQLEFMTQLFPPTADDDFMWCDGDDIT